jgi:hypothetical protein
VAVVEEAFAHVRADEARAAGDEKIHARTLATGNETVEDAGGFAVTEFGVRRHVAAFRRRDMSRRSKARMCPRTPNQETICGTVTLFPRVASGCQQPLQLRLYPRPHPAQRLFF